MSAKVAILMGSSSDNAVMNQAGATLKELGISYVEKVMSAHRNPDAVADFAKGAKDSGIKIIIAAAGMAAHLAGAVAANTTLPVIGVPISSGGLGGIDALLSTVQMPPGVPVATVAINGARNAALLAAQILSLSDDSTKEKLDNFRQQLSKPKTVATKAEEDRPFIDG
ncbi:MAG: 5-(carboxyamino)imidazole ribonucleotide mutase [Actinobacteria bacterium]|nr:MAG: 5-(carboxyamino)imidazole ribonucleotide mutase [Actinomycetota bacterium]